MSTLLENGEATHEFSKLKKINSLLNAAKTRGLGFELLDEFLPQCSDQEFIEWCVSWMQNCCKDSFSKNADSAMILLGKLFKIASNYTELKKSVSFFITTRYFDYFFKHCSDSQAGWGCTEMCLSFFRGACGPFRVSIPEFKSVVNFIYKELKTALLLLDVRVCMNAMLCKQESIDAVDEHLKRQIEKNNIMSSTILRCFALLPSLGGQGTAGINYTVNWRFQFLKYMYLSHSVFNDLFKDVKELKEYDTAGYSYNHLGREAPTNVLVIKLKNYCNILSHMLMDKYAGTKSIPIDLILQLICRGLAVSSATVGKNQTTDIIALKKVLPEVHCSLHLLFNAVITTCGNQLLPYSLLTCKLIKQSLEWINTDCDYENEKAYKILRVSVYETLCNWLVATRSGSCSETISKTIISNALKDIQSSKTTTYLKDLKQTKEQKNTKNRAKGRMSDATDICLCYAALKSLQFFIKYTGALIKAEEQKLLQETVIKVVADIQNGFMADEWVPCSVSPCKEELYCLLGELVNQPCFDWAPPTHFALRLFSRGQNDSCPKVSQFCSSALNILTNIIHSQFDNSGFSAKETGDTLNQVGTSEVNGGEERMEITIEELSTEKETEKALSPNKESNETKDNSDPSALQTETCSPKEIINHSEESNASSCEDSIITVSYGKGDDNEKIGQNGFERRASINEAEDKNEPVCKKQKVGEDSNSDVINPPKTLEDQEAEAKIIKKVIDKLTTPPKNGSDVPKVRGKSSERTSPDEVSRRKTSSESPENENKAKDTSKGYFLRSKSSKSASEEPEDIVKESGVGDRVRPSTPAKVLAKNTPSGLTSKERPKTRAFSKRESTTDVVSAKKNANGGGDEDDDIIAAFYDSLVE